MNKLLPTLLLLTAIHANAQNPSLVMDFGYQPYFTEGRVSFFTRRNYQPGIKYTNGATEIHIVSVKCKEKLYKSELQALLMVNKEPKMIDSATSSLLSKEYAPIPKDLVKLSEEVCKAYS